MIKIATWNVNSIKVRLSQLLEWSGAAAPDILAIQETKIQDEHFPLQELTNLGYNVIYSGQKSYNGMAILSKQEIKDVIINIPTLDDPQKRILAGTVNDLRVINLYVPNGGELTSPKYTYKLDWLSKMTDYIKEECQRYKNIIVLGDFNIAPADCDVHDPAAWEGKVLCSQPERDALRKILDLGFTDSFRLFTQPEKSYTWWDYRMLGYQKNKGLRIDHILVSTALASKCIKCEIDRVPRKWQRPSDHAPVLATFTL